MKTRYLALVGFFSISHLTSRHKYMTCQIKVLKYRHNYLTAGGRYMPPYYIDIDKWLSDGLVGGGKIVFGS